MKIAIRNVLALVACVFAASALAVEQSSALSRNFSAAADSESPYSREGVQYDYVFTGTESGVWETMANWRRPADKIPYVNPYNTWGPAAFDGELMQNSPATATDLEGWEFKVALYNGAKVNIAAINKLQGGCSIRVDETSKLYIGGWGTRAGTMEHTTAITVDAPDGLEFGAGTKSSAHPYTFAYYLNGKGSVKFNGAVAHGTHAVKSRKTIRLIKPG